MHEGVIGGVTEIRTREPLLATTRFPGVPLQPLEHHSYLCFTRLSTQDVNAGFKKIAFHTAKLMLLFRMAITLCNFFVIL